jgi:hypothetical protein
MPLVRLTGVEGGRRHVTRYLWLVALVALLVVAVVPASALACSTPISKDVKIGVSASTITAGNSLTVTVTVNPATKGSTVTLYSGRWCGGFTKVGSQKIGSSASVTWTVKPTRNTKFYATWDRSGKKTEASKCVFVAVRAKLTLSAKVSPYASGVGTPVAISGTVVPKYCGMVRIQVSQSVPGSCSKVVFCKDVKATAGIGDSSVFSTIWTAKQTGKFTIKATIKDCSNEFFGGSICTVITL